MVVEETELVRDVKRNSLVGFDLGAFHVDG